MPRTDKQAGGVSGPEDSAERSRHAQRGKALPSPETVVSEAIFISPKGRVYRILRTNQTDPYDPPAGQAKEMASDHADDKPQQRRGKRRREHE
jgi:hypothetical protein